MLCKISFNFKMIDKVTILKIKKEKAKDKNVNIVKEQL